MDEHPRIALLRSQVLSRSVDEQYRAKLLQSIYTPRDQILARPRYAPGEGWDDLETLQQVTLGSIMERALREAAEHSLQRRSGGQTSAPNRSNAPWTVTFDYHREGPPGPKSSPK